MNAKISVPAVVSAIGLLLAGCSTSIAMPPHPSTDLWVGRSEAQLVHEWGVPLTQRQGSDGTWVYTYDYVHRSRPALAGRRVVSPSLTETGRCLVEFDIGKDGRVQATRMSEQT